VQFEGFAGGGSSQCGPFVPVFSAFGVAPGLADGLAAGLAVGAAIRHPSELLLSRLAAFKGLPGEQATMFFLDPSGNALEFKSSRIVAEQLLRRERKKVLVKYAPWEILAAFIWCWVLLHAHAGDSADEIPAQLPPCASKCMP